MTTPSESISSAVPPSEGTNGFALDDQRLLEWLRHSVPKFANASIISSQRFSGGQSNPTYAVAIDGVRLVLRKKPPGQLLAGAHAVEREFRVISALHEAGFPVPRPVALCEDVAAIGTAFFLMEHVDGRIFWDLRLPELPQHDRSAYYDSMNATLAALHNTDLAATELTTFGRAGNYFERQLKRWGAQYREDVLAGRVASMDLLLDWLQTHIPSSDETTLVHGNFRMDNIVFHPSEPRVIAVLDWELSTLGHPLADFGYHLMPYRLPDMLLPGLRDRDPVALGLPSEADYVAAYCHRTGRIGIDNLEYYLAFNMFRAAAIFHGIRGRVIRGTATSAQATEVAKRVEQLADLGWNQARSVRAG
jgi:aminoglycoside phosphotransferase (APT) family kinase protein